MRRIVLIVAVALAAPAWGQAPKPAAKPEAKPAAKPAPHKSRRHEDARSCLERGSNTEIIKCAEAYL
jgi:hypothetical protein